MITTVMNLCSIVIFVQKFYLRLGEKIRLNLPILFDNYVEMSVFERN